MSSCTCSEWIQCTEPESSPKVIAELYYFLSSNRILTQKKKKEKARRNKIIASYICKVMIDQDS